MICQRDRTYLVADVATKGYTLSATTPGVHDVRRETDPAEPAPYYGFLDARTAEELS